MRAEEPAKSESRDSRVFCSSSSYSVISSYRPEPLTSGISSSTSPATPITTNGRTSSDMKRAPDQTPGPPESARKRLRISEAELRPVKADSGHDFYCWSCHKEKAVHSCTTCVRSYHTKCLTNAGLLVPADKFVCGECQLVSDMTENPVRALRSLSAEELNGLIHDIIREVKVFALPYFHVPVPLANYPDYAEKIINPVSFQELNEKCSDNQYTTPQALISDMTWIYHNSAIYNGYNPVTANAEQFLKVAVSRVVDLKMCPDCFINSSAKPPDWFTEPCRKPHVLVMAKVKGQSLISHSAGSD